MTETAELIERLSNWRELCPKDLVLETDLSAAADHLAKLQAENDRLTEALKPFARQPLSTEPEFCRTRVFSFSDADERIKAARSALSPKEEGKA